MLCGALRTLDFRYYFGFFSLLIRLVRILSVSPFLCLLPVLSRGDYILQLSSNRVATVVSCRRWSWLFIRRSLVYFSPLGSRYVSSWLVDTVHLPMRAFSRFCANKVICYSSITSVFLLVTFRPLLILIGPEFLISIRFCGPFFLQ